MTDENAETNMEVQTESTRCLPALLSEVPPMHMMATLQVMNSAPGRRLENEQVKELMAAGVRDLYFKFGAEDPADVVLSMLIVGVTSATVDCLGQAASISSEYQEARELNLRYGLKGAAAAADLIKALDARRGNSEPRAVTVRDVNVEAGAQAIIGNVEAPRRKGGLEPRGSEPLKQEDKPELEGDDG